MTPTERAAHITMRLLSGECLTARIVSEEYGVTRKTSYLVLDKISTVVPIYKDSAFWRLLEMPRKQRRPCLATGCPELVENGNYCDRHRARLAAEDGRLSASQRGYDVVWRRLRRMHLAEHPLCVHCKQEGRVTVATEVDHIQPLADGGTNDSDNLQSLCKSCHSRKTRRAMGKGG